MSEAIRAAGHGQQGNLLTVALKYADAGVAVFATTQDGKAPAISNRTWGRYLGREILPGQGGLHLATTDPDTVRWMFSQRGAGGIGMPCGKVNDVIVADFDTHKEAPGGNAHRRLLQFEDEIEAAHRVRTRNGGLHAYFRYRAGHGKHELGENIEVQSDGAYVLLPPSKGYRIENMVFAEDWDPPPWPPAGNATRAPGRGPEPATLGEFLAEIDALQAQIDQDRGQWHNAMVRLTARLVGIGWSDAEILRFVPSWTSGGYTDEQTFREVATAIAGARAKWKPAPAPETTHEARLQKFADLWNRSAPGTRRAIASMIRGACDD